jgi:hypothetical protein
VIAGGKGTAADKFRALDAAGARTVKSPADLGKAMAELLAKSRAKAAKMPAPVPHVLIIEPKGSSSKQRPKGSSSKQGPKASSKKPKTSTSKKSPRKPASKAVKKAVKPQAKKKVAAKKAAPKKKPAKARRAK